MKVDNSTRVPFNVNVLKKVISKELNGYIFTRGGHIVTQIISEGVNCQALGKYLY